MRPGPDGYAQFTDAIRRAFSLPNDSELNITFTCDEPTVVEPLAPLPTVPIALPPLVVPSAPPPPPPPPPPPAPGRSAGNTGARPLLQAATLLVTHLYHAGRRQARTQSRCMYDSRVTDVRSASGAVHFVDAASIAGSLLTLQGAGAYDAAVHCASVSAARRMLQQRYLSEMLPMAAGAGAFRCGRLADQPSTMQCAQPVKCLFVICHTNMFTDGCAGLTWRCQDSRSQQQPGQPAQKQQGQPHQQQQQPQRQHRACLDPLTDAQRSGCQRRSPASCATSATC